MGMQASIEEPKVVSKEQEVMELLDSDFEKGLLELKELVKMEQTGEVQTSFETK